MVLLKYPFNSNRDLVVMCACVGEASFEVRQAYKQFAGAVGELIDGEVVSEEFCEVALAVYHLFGKPAEEDNNGRRFTEKK